MSVKPNLAKRTTKRSSAGLQRLSCTPWRVGSISSPGSVESGRSDSALHSPESFGRPAAGSRAGFRCGIKLAGVGIRSRLQRELRLYRLRDETANGSPPQFLIMGGRHAGVNAGRRISTQPRAPACTASYRTVTARRFAGGFGCWAGVVPGNSNAPISKAAPFGRATPSKSVLIPELIPASIAGLPGRSRRFNVPVFANFGSAFTLPVRNFGPAAAPKNRLFDPVTFAAFEEVVKYVSPGSKKKMLFFIATAMAPLVPVVIPPESRLRRAPQSYRVLLEICTAALRPGSGPALVPPRTAMQE